MLTFTIEANEQPMDEKPNSYYAKVMFVSPLGKAHNRTEWGFGETTEQAIRHALDDMLTRRDLF